MYSFGSDLCNSSISLSREISPYLDNNSATILSFTSCIGREPPVGTNVCKQNIHMIYTVVARNYIPST